MPGNGHEAMQAGLQLAVGGSRPSTCNDSILGSVLGPSKDIELLDCAQRRARTPVKGLETDVCEESFLSFSPRKSA